MDEATISKLRDTLTEKLDDIILGQDKYLMAQAEELSKNVMDAFAGGLFESEGAQLVEDARFLDGLRQKWPDIWNKLGLNALDVLIDALLTGNFELVGELIAEDVAQGLGTIGEKLDPILNEIQEKLTSTYFWEHPEEQAELLKSVTNQQIWYNKRLDEGFGQRNILLDNALVYDKNFWEQIAKNAVDHTDWYSSYQLDAIDKMKRTIDKFGFETIQPEQWSNFISDMSGETDKLTSSLNKQKDSITDWGTVVDSTIDDTCDIMSDFGKWQEDPTNGMFFPSHIESIENYNKRMEEEAQAGKVDIPVTITPQIAEDFDINKLMDAPEFDVVPKLKEGVDLQNLLKSQDEQIVKMPIDINDELALTNSEILRTNISDIQPIMEVDLYTTPALLDAQNLAFDISQITPVMTVQVDVSANAGQIQAIVEQAVYNAIQGAYES